MLELWFAPEQWWRVICRGDKERVFLASDRVFGQREVVDPHAMCGGFVAAVPVAAGFLSQPKRKIRLRRTILVRFIFVSTPREHTHLRFMSEPKSGDSFALFVKKRVAYCDPGKSVIGAGAY